MARSTAIHRDPERLKTCLKELPAAPGVYRFYDIGGALIYVGKSVCLRDRVRSYFSGRAATTKLRRMRQEISHLDWEQTGSELEALLLESRLVKRHQPRFNVMLRDFVPLPYVRVDLRDSYPRLEVTRVPERDGASYFGPYRSQSTLEAGVNALSDALRLRDCAGSGDRLPGHRPCYRYEFGTCSGPCLGAVAPEEYRRAIASACAVFEGREETVIDALRARMERAAEHLQFEVAARLRDAIRHIQGVSGRQHALFSAVHELSLVAACPSRREDCLSLFVFCSGRMVLHEEAPRTELASVVTRLAWARRLVAAWREGAAGAPPEMDTALLDEIQIVTGWMKQHTGEGAWQPLHRELDDEEQALLLAGWLCERAASQGCQDAQRAA